MIERLWAWAEGDDYGLLPDLAADAVLARARAGSTADRRLCLPRLVELVVEAEADFDKSVEVMGLVGEVAASSLDDRSDLVAVLEDWWLQALRSGGDADRTLALLARSGEPMKRWLDLWLAELDGEGADQLATVVLEGLGSPGWDGVEDEAGQVLAWARSETVINGLTMIGGIHLNPDRLSHLLDVLI